MGIFDNIPDEVTVDDDAQVENPEGDKLPDEVNVEDNQAPEEEPKEDNAEDVSVAEEGETPQEPTEDPAPEEPSSLTSEPKEPVQEPTEPAEPTEVSDEQIFTALSEKLGREVKSYEDLTSTEEADPFNGDAELKAIAEWKERTGRPVSDWQKYQKDYDSMNQEDVVREHLRHTYPDLTEEEIGLEMQEYIPDEDMDTDNEAARKRLRLKKQAATARKELNKFRTTFDTPVEPNVPAEYQQAMDFYKKQQEQMQKSQGVAKDFQTNISSKAKNLKSIPLSLSEDSKINLNLSEEESREIPKLITETPHWFNKDGSYNYDAIVKDAVKMKHFDKAVKAAYDQGVNDGIEKEDTSSRNVDFTKAKGSNPTGGEDIVIEGADDMLNGGRLKIGGR